MSAPFTPGIPTSGRIAPCSLRQGQPPPAVALAGQPCRPLRAALLEKTGRDEEVVPAIEQRGWIKRKNRMRQRRGSVSRHGAEGGTSGSPSVCEGD